MPGKALIQVTATLSYLSPPFLTAIAFVYLFSPNAGLINVLMRDVLGLPLLTFNIFSMTGLVLVTVLHTFPFVYLLASSALHSVDASYEEAAQILGASKLRTALLDHRAAGGAGDPVRHAARLRQRHRAVRLAGDHRPARPHRDPADAHLRAVRLSAANTASPPRCRWSSSLITVVALYLQRAFLARRSFVTLAGKGARPQLMSARRRALAGVRLLRARLHRRDHRCPTPR